MTMRYVVKFYPITDAEIPQAKEAIAEMLGVIRRRQGHSHLAPVVEAVETNPEDYCKGNRMVKVDGHTHFTDQIMPMCFGSALAALKSGKKVARHGWNGKGMWVVMMPGLQLPPHSSQEPGAKVNDRTAKHIGPDTPLDSQPYFALWTAAGKWQPGWVPSVSDCLAEDWVNVE